MSLDSNGTLKIMIEVAEGRTIDELIKLTDLYRIYQTEELQLSNNKYRIYFDANHDHFYTETVKDIYEDMVELDSIKEVIGYVGYIYDEDNQHFKVKLEDNKLKVSKGYIVYNSFEDMK